MSRTSLSRFVSDRRANVSITYAFSALPIIVALGMSLDYGVAARARTKMNAAADAAALLAVTPAMMAGSPNDAKTAATNFFVAQTSSISGVNFTNNATNLVVTVTDSSSTNVTRSVTVTYKATSTNAFGGILNMATTAIGGTSSSSAAASPNIDFYLMLDTSPSMAIPATQDGITWMSQHSGNQCAFACHEMNPSSGNPGNIDNYTLAQQNNIQIRMNLVTAAASQLPQTAQKTASANQAAYRMAAYTFDVATNQIFGITSDLSTASTKAGGVQMYEVYSENTNCVQVVNGKCVKTVGNNDQDTDFETAFTRLNTDMPTPGNGTNKVGDKPQEVLFIVTDSIADESYNGGRIYKPLGGTTSNDGTTQDWCTKIKNRGIRIAVLYTTYNPLPLTDQPGGGASWYAQFVKQWQPVAPVAAKTCASSGLFFQVDVGGDITAAMNTLFQNAVNTAHLTY